MLEQDATAVAKPSAPPAGVADLGNAAALHRLHELSLRLLRADTLERVLGEVLEAAIELTRADFGTVQLRDPATGELEIVAQRGLAAPFLERVRRIAITDPYPPSHAALRRECVVVEDLEQDPVYQPLLGLISLAGFRAAQAMPMYGATGEVLGILCTLHREPRRRDQAELDVLELYAQSAILAIERVRAVADADATRRLQATLFDSIEQAYSLIEVLFDDQGRPHDCRYHACNAAFTTQTGLGDVVGHTLKEFVDYVEPLWLESFAKVARTGKASLFEHESSALGRWFSVYAFAVDEAPLSKVAVVFKDITAARRVEARNRFLLDLEDATRALSEPDQIAATATRLLAEHLECDRAVYMNVDDDQDGVTIVGEYSPQHPSVLGRYRFAEFSEGTRVGFREGRTFAFDDVDKIELSDEERQRYLVRQVRAMIQVPLHKDGRLRATVAVYHATPKRWRPHDAGIVEDVAHRLWETIERTRVTR